MEKPLLDLLENGGVVGAIVVTTVVIVGMFLRYKGFLMPEVNKSVTGPEIKALSSKIGQIDARLNDVERDIQHLPTRSEIHEIELSITRLEGRFENLDNTTKATSRAVSRIEDFMIDVSKRSKA